jgi:hypothetical protein
MPGSSLSRVIMVVVAVVVILGLILSTMAMPMIGQ